MTRKTGSIVPALLWQCSYGRNKPQGFVLCSQTRHFYARQPIGCAAGKKTAHIHILTDISTMKIQEVHGINRIWQDSCPQKRTPNPKTNRNAYSEGSEVPCLPWHFHMPSIFYHQTIFLCGHPEGSWTILSPEAPFNLSHKIPTSYSQEGSPYKYRRESTKWPIWPLRSPFASQDKTWTKTWCDWPT